MRRTKKDAALTRETVLDAALAVFSRQGYAATTLDHIAQEAGVTRGAIYWHFGGKAELYNALLEERFARAFAGVAKLLAEPGPPLQIIRRLLVWQMTLIEEDAEYRDVMELTLFKTAVTPDLAEGLKHKVKATQQMLRQLSKLFRQAVKAGEVRQKIDADSAALAALGLTTGLTSLWLLNPSSFSIKARAPEIVDLFLSGMAN
jgi:TetR/AcrR family transcriptional regulator, acrAB operon repressor